MRSGDKNMHKDWRDIQVNVWQCLCLEVRQQANNLVLFCIFKLFWLQTYIILDIPNNYNHPLESCNPVICYGTATCCVLDTFCGSVSMVGDGLPSQAGTPRHLTKGTNVPWHSMQGLTTALGSKHVQPSPEECMCLVSWGRQLGVIPYRGKNQGRCEVTGRPGLSTQSF